MSVAVVDGTGRTKAAQALPVSVVDVLSALPSPASVPRGTRAFAIDKGVELVAYGGAWLPAAGALPIGAVLPYAGAVDPGDIGGGITFLLADGRLISRVTYAAFFTIVGHKYNGGVDPGSSQVRIPDKRGRVTVGPDNMGTAQGAASRIPNSNRVAGQNGGEELHALAAGEMPVHAHAPKAGGTGGFVQAALGGPPVWVTLGSGTSLGIADPSSPSVNGTTANAGGSAAHNNLQPYEVDNVIVRVA